MRAVSRTGVDVVRSDEVLSATCPISHREGAGHIEKEQLQLKIENWDVTAPSRGPGGGAKQNSGSAVRLQILGRILDGVQRIVLGRLCSLGRIIGGGRRGVSRIVHC